MRKVKFVEGEFYHIFNRGVDKRTIFQERDDLDRFFQSMKEFNVIEPIGSIYENSFNKNNKNRLGNLVSKSESGNNKQEKLVNFICYCLNPNHYHFILEPLVENGITKLMHKVGLGYTKYINEKYDRSGSLFQGTFKAVHINTDTQLLHTSVYVNLNDKVHQLGNSVSKLGKSSWREYIDENIKNSFCTKDIILGQFKNKADYKKFAEESLESILEKRDMDEKELFLE